MTTFLIFVVMCSALYIAWSHYRAWKQAKPAIKSSPQPKKLPARADPWVEEWLSALRNQHRIIRIDSGIPIRMKNDGRILPQPGFAAICKCGNRSIGINLAQSKRIYESHLRHEGEIALAAINRFEMPAGINWTAEIERTD